MLRYLQVYNIVELTSLYSMLCSPQPLLPSVSTQHHCNIVDSIPYAVLFILMTYSFHNCNGMPCTPTGSLHLPLPSPVFPVLPSSFHLATINFFSIYISDRKNQYREERQIIYYQDHKSKTG